MIRFDNEGMMYGAIVLGVMVTLIAGALGWFEYILYGLTVGAPLWLGIGILIFIGYQYEQRRARKGQ